MNVNPVLFAKAIADVTRQKIMSECCCCWISVGDLASKLEVTQPTVSHHLAILRDAGLVKLREEGKEARPMKITTTPNKRPNEARNATSVIGPISWTAILIHIKEELQIAPNKRKINQCLVFN